MQIIKKSLYPIRIIFLIVLFPIFNLFSQNEWEEVVYLKNGGIIRGIIIEQVPNDKLKIQTSDGNVFVFKLDEIEKITKEQKYINSNYKYPETNFQTAPYQTSLAVNNIKTIDPKLDTYRKQGILNTTFGAVYFTIGLPLMIRGIRMGGFEGYANGRSDGIFSTIFGTGLTIGSIPLLILGPIKLTKYKNLKKENSEY